MTTDQFRYLTYEVTDSIATVWLNRPPVNAVDMDFYAELESFFSDVSSIAADARVVVLAGAGKHFCAGHDLNDFMTMTPENGALRMKQVRQAFFAIYDAPMPVIAAVHGAALGTGLAIAASCDLIIAAEGARFGLPEITIGVMGGARHLSRLVPQAQVRWMHYTGESVPVEDLMPYGGILRVVPGEDLLQSATEAAAAIARYSPVAIHSAKRSLNTIEAMDLKQGYEFEQGLSVALSGTSDAKEALSAFVEKRAPVFTSDIQAGESLYER